jgi:hypothetical protein
LNSVVTKALRFLRDYVFRHRKGGKKFCFGAFIVAVVVASLTGRSQTNLKNASTHATSIEFSVLLLGNFTA